MKVRVLFFTSLWAVSACVAPTSAEPKEHEVGGKTAGDVFDAQIDADLARAACTGDLHVLTQALAAGANPNASGYEGVTPLIWTLNCENIDGMKALLDAGADPNVRFGIDTPVTLAAGARNSKLLQVLLENGGNPSDYALNSPWSALKIALGLGIDTQDYTNYWLLINAGADINQTVGGRTIAQFAVAMNCLDLVIDLLDRGYDANLEELGISLGNSSSEYIRALMPPGQSENLDIAISMLRERGIEVPPPRPIRIRD